MPGREIKGTSKIANYRHGGRAGYNEGKKVYPVYNTKGRIVGSTDKKQGTVKGAGKQPKLAGTDEAGRLIKRPTKDDVIKGKA